MSFVENRKCFLNWLENLRNQLCGINNSRCVEGVRETLDEKTEVCRISAILYAWIYNPHRFLKKKTFIGEFEEKKRTFPTMYISTPQFLSVPFLHVLLCSFHFSLPPYACRQTSQSSPPRYRSSQNSNLPVWPGWSISLSFKPLNNNHSVVSGKCILFPFLFSNIKIIIIIGASTVSRAVSSRTKHPWCRAYGYYSRSNSSIAGRTHD